MVSRGPAGRGRRSRRYWAAPGRSTCQGRPLSGPLGCSARSPAPFPQWVPTVSVTIEHVAWLKRRQARYDTRSGCVGAIPLPLTSFPGFPGVRVRARHPIGMYIGMRRWPLHRDRYMLAAASARSRPEPSTNGDPIHEITCPGGGHRWRRGRLQRPLPPRQARLEGRGPDRALGAHRRLDLARRRRHAHVQLRPQRRQAPGLHPQGLQGDRGGVRAVLRHPPHRRPHARRHARPARLPQHRPRPWPLPRPGHRVHRSG